MNSLNINTDDLTEEMLWLWMQVWYNIAKTGKIWHNYGNNVNFRHDKFFEKGQTFISLISLDVYLKNLK